MGNPRPYRRLEPILDHCIKAAIDAVDGEFDENGHYGTLVYTGITGPGARARAYEIKQALYRSARHMKVSMFYKIEHDSDGTYSVRYTVVSKQHARTYQVRERGPDRSKWAYDPRAPKGEQ